MGVHLVVRPPHSLLFSRGPHQYTFLSIGRPPWGVTIGKLIFLKPTTIFLIAGWAWFLWFSTPTFLFGGSGQHSGSHRSDTSLPFPSKKKVRYVVGSTASLAHSTSSVPPFPSGYLGFTHPVPPLTPGTVCLALVLALLFGSPVSALSSYS